MEEVYKHKHIIFGSDHYNTLGAIRSLGEAGIKPDIILHPAYSNNPILCTNSKYRGKIYIVSSIEEGYEILISIYSNEPLKPFVYSCDDFQESYLDLHYDEIFQKFFFFNGLKKGIVTRYMDKEAISSLAESYGATIPKSEIVRKGELPRKLNYPIITKSIQSIKGAWKQDSRICYSEEQLINEYKTIVSDVLLVEEFINKKNELCLDGFSINNGKDIYLPFKATYERLSPQGYSNYMTIEPFINECLIKQISNILQAVGFNGVFSVEYLIDQNDKLYFLEVNFRNSTWSYAYTVGGVNLLLEWAKGMITGNIDEKNISPTKNPFKAVAEFKHYYQFVCSGEISFIRWVLDVLSSKCKFYWSIRDPKPAIVHILNIFKEKRNRRLRR